jgi:sulfur-oxidizing protein SoxY
MRRRAFLVTGVASAWAPLIARAQALAGVQDIRPLIQGITRGATAIGGGLEVELPQLAENGNSVPLRIRAASPMTPADHVKAIHVLAERNPRPRVATFHFSPASGRAEVTTRVRLAGSQTVTVVAELSDNSFRIAEAKVLVTTGACLDDSL